MSSDKDRLNDITSTEENNAVRYLKDAVAEGKPWHIALLEAIGLWTCSEESHNGYHYCYLLDGEAFDWLLLAERLCLEITEAIPENQLIDIIFFGRLPEEVTNDEFKEFIGSAKYHAHLNYLYGVTVERFVILALEEEIRKERQGQVFSARDGGGDDSYQRLYGAGQEALLRQFRDERGHIHSGGVYLSELQDFTYWMFKYRIRNCDKERVASDTKKGVDYLKRQNIARGLPLSQKEPPEEADHLF